MSGELLWKRSPERAPGPHAVSLYSKELNGVIVGVDLKTTHLELIFSPTLNDLTQVYRQGVPSQTWFVAGDLSK